MHVHVQLIASLSTTRDVKDLDTRSLRQNFGLPSTSSKTDQYKFPFCHLKRRQGAQLPDCSYSVSRDNFLKWQFLLRKPIFPLKMRCTREVYTKAHFQTFGVSHYLQNEVGTNIHQYFTCTCTILAYTCTCINACIYFVYVYMYKIMYNISLRGEIIFF